MKHTSLEELREWMARPEGRLEFKEARTNFHFESLLEYCVGLANEGGGKFILGVTDQRPRAIVGSAAFSEPGRTEAGIYDRLQQRVPVEELNTPQGRVVIVHVPSRLPGSAWSTQGKYLKRAGDALVPMRSDELQAIFAESGPDFSAEVCPEATLTSLNLQAVREFRSRWNERQPDSRRLAWSDQEILANAELMVDGRVTFAALILFGTPEALGRFLPQAELVFEYRPSEASGPAADRHEFRQGFFQSRDRLWDLINLRNDRQSYQLGLFRRDVPTFSEVSVREGLLNAVAHRDYRLGGSIFVRQGTRRLEIVSPGGFPLGVTAENILEQQHPRNRRLAEALGKCGLIERSGQGVNLMFEAAIRDSKDLPSFAGTSGHEVRLTLEGAVTSPEFLTYLDGVGQERLASFSTYDYLVLDVVRRGVSVPDHLRSRLPQLVEVGVLESIGRGRGRQYILSRELYKAIGAPGAYTRNRGLDRETNKALLEKHIQLCGSAGAPLAELRQVLPAVSERTVQSLLQELRDVDKVWVDGQKRWARWKLGPKPMG